MNGGNAGNREILTSDSLPPQNRKRKIGSTDRLREWPSRGSLNATGQAGRLPELQHFNHGTLSGQETPKPRQSSPEGSVRRSGRKKRKISNYKRLIDVGAATSSEDGT